jgi:hypothetical protein
MWKEAERELEFAYRLRLVLGAPTLYEQYSVLRTKLAQHDLAQVFGRTGRKWQAWTNDCYGRRYLVRTGCGHSAIMRDSGIPWRLTEPFRRRIRSTYIQSGGPQYQDFGASPSPPHTTKADRRTRIPGRPG